MSQAFLTFQLANRGYALPINVVQEVIRLVQIAPLLDAPREVLGVINVRGVPTLVIDLRVRYGLPPLPFHHDDTPLILVQVPINGTLPLVALLVDKVDGVVSHTVPVAPSGMIQMDGTLFNVIEVAQLPTVNTIPLLMSASHSRNAIVYASNESR